MSSVLHRHRQNVETSQRDVSGGVSLGRRSSATSLRRITFVRFFASLLLLSLLLPSVAAAQQVQTNACVLQVFQMLSHEERFFRGVLYGQKKSELLPAGSVRTDKELNRWIKTGDGEWKSYADGYSGTMWSDGQMDNEADVPARRGIFEIRKASTSELIPPILQSLRALQCRLRAVCRLAKDSLGADPEDAIRVEVDGCLPQGFHPLPQCLDAESAGEVGIGICEQAVEAILEREVQLLKTAVAYDAAYRTLLQFAGQFEGFLDDFQLPLLTPLWQAVRALGSLGKIPCFLSQCDE